MYCVAEHLKRLDGLLSGDKKLTTPIAYCWFWMHIQYRKGKNIKTEKLPYGGRSYFISLKNIACQSKHFFKLENMAEDCRCSVVSFIGLLRYHSFL